MKRFLYLITLFLLLSSFLLNWLTSCSTSTGQSEPKPNVIIMITDDQGYGDLSCLGNPVLKTPNLDRLYDESVRFTDFHVAPVCTPTRSQLLTGLDAVRNGSYSTGGLATSIFHSYPDTLGNDTEIHLMSEYFKANGYLTGHFGKWHLGEHYPYRSMDRGFDSTHTFRGASVWQSPSHWNNDCFNDIYDRNGIPERTKGYNTDIWFEEAISFMEHAVEVDMPFFIYLPTGAVHTPLFVPAVYMEPYNDLTPLEARFFGMIANFDENYGKLDVSLEELGIRENTIVIFMTDNGGTVGVDLYNAGMKGRKGQLYDGGHRVPCFIRWPKGIPEANRDIGDLTIVQDILPTLIDMCDLDTPWQQQFDGVNLTRLILGEEQVRDGVPDLEERMSVVQYRRRTGLNEFTVLWNNWRLINRNELYNITSDPGQRSNVIQDHPEVADRMVDHYVSWRKSVEPSIEKVSPIDIGYDGFTSTELACFEWVEKEGNGNASQQNDVRQGMNMRGTWKILVHEGGSYELLFRRWPAEADCAISDGLPPHFTEFSKQIGWTTPPPEDSYQMWKQLCVGGVLPAGKALPISKARFIMDGTTYAMFEVGPSDKAVRVVPKLEEGLHEIRLDFLDNRGEPLCGAYYANVTKL